MARILGVGIATLDIISTVQRYPAEDGEVRAIAQRRGREQALSVTKENPCQGKGQEQQQEHGAETGEHGQHADLE